MQANTVRSGLVEARHPVEVVAVGADGTVLGRWGDLRRPYFARSAVKPVQGTVSQESGARLSSLELAVGCASHTAEPMHVAMVRRMLDGVGLDESALQCPPAWPTGSEARRRLIAAGHSRPGAVFHNCSGKHAAMLRACIASGWPTDSYRDPQHPLQQRVTAAMTEVSGEQHEPLGVDGCGLPTFRITTEGLARVFAAVASMERFRPAAEAMHRYPALTSGTGRPEPKIAMAVNAAVKGGAEGCLGAAVMGQFGVAAKAHDGSFDSAVVGMIAALRALGVLPETARHGVAGIERFPVLGGGQPVGALEITAIAE